ncbi:MAG: asparagine--tRNA ligase [Candidatus Raymondbacteria bacterium RifOxyA12_full_50_37]|uniref:Asparagine--tRNA ligase n=1 Tax=Candidatus Raymondbacteria bacterium RIFOXYD12_FULL_49_13 TaxID=1817890 RepID=A0A1F7F1E4_UNCRA|nr:MAG: asparagine--tRNA ligase [Candidatus Raymondbacteria bacterium RifOxyA12_full_50_37]OGJ93160.1 MAG: asparagine--tRNA ligase [Candidatus Raymondbacteria bacterium RifOxyB12_full_50_8]OGJ93885.1 MAG: asparagine--tRNA ligase [Candidatus Raymondbacteria bacterium RIFOXYA2_FULL_49_16]OGJ98246.1 MAG: asparagine--tRNA ligase [Candidatus Raymondbacteria bacterium RIFOXYC2_FULL_50_21]OGK00479.1 MAG: asparagine--tRNA ligase [Candidatus Raymondbacteria bacterium RIFOXYD12_FULL_49_13]OGK05200.1 MAG
MNTTIAQLLKSNSYEQEIFVSGWVRTHRGSKGGFSFIEVNDGSCLKNIQVIADEALPNYKNEIQSITTGTSVTIRGKLVSSMGKGQPVEIRATEITVLGYCDTSYPLQKKRHSFEFLRTIGHLRARTNTFGAVARVRHALSYAIHSFFNEHGFYYVHTPIITTSDCEGAGEMFRVSTLDLMNLPMQAGQIDFTHDFFGKPANLTVSGQLEGEAYATAIGKIYTFGPTFRAENSNTTRHLAEFWMVEPEAAFFDLPALMNLAEQFLKSILQVTLHKCPNEMDFFDTHIRPGLLATLEQTIVKRFETISYTDAIALLEKSGTNFNFPISWGSDLQSEHERFLTEEIVKGPTIIYDYPKEIKAFYMRQNDDGRTVRAMDVLIPGIGEIIGGSQREERYDLLNQAIIQKGLDPEKYWWYLDLRRYGSVPHAGFGLGFERAMLGITGMENIRDVIPFPRTPKNADF